MTQIEIKRIYEPYQKSDGFRVLVDRLWPRGIAKVTAHIDLWDKGISPSTEVRQMFNHEDDKWVWFKKAYLSELKGNKVAVDSFLSQIKGKSKITLLYGAKSPDHNHAIILRDFLRKKI